MNLSTVLLFALLAVICVFSIISYRKKLQSGCCGTDAGAPKKATVSDTDASHYPYTQTLRVEQMHCKNCVKTIENTLNAQSGIWSTANLTDHTVLIRAKSPIATQEMLSLLQAAGYGGAYALNAEP